MTETGRRVAAIIEYDGTDYAGWQSQAHCTSIQDAVQAALSFVAGHPVVAICAGRTDAGVHALGQSVHFLTASKHSPEIFVRALNAMLPADLRVLAARERPQAFHATLDARSKRYR